MGHKRVRVYVRPYEDNPRPSRWFWLMGLYKATTLQSPLLLFPHFFLSLSSFQFLPVADIIPLLYTLSFSLHSQSYTLLLSLKI